MNTTDKPRAVACIRFVRRWWRLIYRVEWDKRGHWIVSRKKDHTHHLWFMIGRCESDDGISIYQMVIGPIGIAVGWTPNAIGDSQSPAKNL